MKAPPTGRQRMEFHFDWEHLLRGGYADEIILKGWFPQNRCVQDRIFPVARRLRVPVCIVDRNHSLLDNPSAVEAVTAKVGDACAAGCNGFVFCEMADYVRHNEANRPSIAPVFAKPSNAPVQPPCSYRLRLAAFAARCLQSGTNRQYSAPSLP